MEEEKNQTRRYHKLGTGDCWCSVIKVKDSTSGEVTILHRYEEGVFLDERTLIIKQKVKDGLLF